MKLNNLTPEDIAFIKELSHEMRTQDTRGTAQPYGLTITQEEIVRKDKGCGSELACNWNDEFYLEDDWDRFLEDVKEYYEGWNIENTSIQSVLNMLNFNELRDTFEADFLDADIFEIDRERVIDPMKFNFFLTEKGANEYLKQDRHNLSKPQTFGVYLKRNDEISKLIEIVHKIADSVEKE